MECQRMIYAAFGHEQRSCRRKYRRAPAVLFVLWISGTSALAQVETKTFTNTYISFDIATTWDCERDGTEFVCQEKGLKQVSSIAILAAKLVNPAMDDPAVYASELALQRNLTTP